MVQKDLTSSLTLRQVALTICLPGVRHLLLIKLETWLEGDQLGPLLIVQGRFNPLIRKIKI